VSYESVVLADSPSFLWVLNDTSTTAADATGNGLTGTYTGGYTQSQSGEPGIGLNATAFNGSTGYVYSNTKTSTGGAGPTVFSLECWFKVANGYSSGGDLIGFAQGVNPITNSSDRFLWMLNSGQIAWGSGDGYEFIADDIVSSGSYNDGNWHYAVASYTAASIGGVYAWLYVDAVLQGTVTVQVLQDYDGYWTCGANLVTAWTPPGATSSDYIAGTLSCVAVYPVALSGTQVSNHYNAASAPSAAPFYPAGRAIRARLPQHQGQSQQIWEPGGIYVR
jgi:hypothetical protein